MSFYYEFFNFFENRVLAYDAECFPFTLWIRRLMQYAAKDQHIPLRLVR